MKHRLCCVLAVLALSAQPSFASTIVIGGTGLANVFPFGANAYLGEYQQIYSSAAFSAPMTITQIAFETSGAGSAIVDNFTLSLGTTAATPAAPGSNYAANKRPDLTTVFSGIVTDPATGSGVFDFIINLSSPFVYNPVSGNLLLDVVIASDLVTPGGFVGFVFGPTPNVGRVFNAGGNGAATAGPNEGLLTQFSDTVAATVPEPATLTLLGSGIVAIASQRRRRVARR